MNSENLRDINRRIAELSGWTVVDDDYWNWTTNEEKCAGLLDEMPCVSVIRWADGSWYCECAHITREHPDRKIAICLTWIAWKEVKR